MEDGVNTAKIFILGIAASAVSGNADAAASSRKRYVDESIKENYEISHFQRLLTQSAFNGASLKWNEEAYRRIRNAVGDLIIADKNKVIMLNLKIASYMGLLTELYKHPEIWQDAAMLISGQRLEDCAAGNRALKACAAGLAASAFINAEQARSDGKFPALTSDQWRPGE